ncbi:MAG: SUMF1/EgtB/PvdO family nonheme iron enzyme [Deltaproteobacteria bacterium]|nr:SUMF1/EgtB/PvdO family nonheme iron enzyme [Deltaproteobacteria bacterium]
MISVWTRVAAAGLLGLLTSGCGLFGSSDDGGAEQSGLQAGGGSSGASGAAGSSGASDAPDGGDAGQETGQQPGCTGLPGPAMVELSSPNGVKYCIDGTEVTQAHYAAFFADTKATPGSEHPECTANPSYDPEVPFFPEGTPCGHGDWSPAQTPNRPVVCVDWCDAFAYCKWAGKRLCGKIGGEPAAYGTSSDLQAAGASESEWYNACSQGGTTVYPYGDAYEAKTCAGYESAPGGQIQTNTDVGTFSNCKGKAPPFSSVLDLSGSVYEFTDESFPGAPGVNDRAYRGGSFADPGAEAQTCRSLSGASPTYRTNDTGFRCCKNLL